MRWVRKLTFYLFAAGYLVGCPLTIAYALGYLYEPGTEHGLVQTGLISLATEPPGATIYVNNKRYTKKTPAVLHGVLPGEYRVRVSLRDHHPWTRTITVEGARAAAHEHIVLAPTVWRPETVVAEPFDQLLPLSGDRFALLLTDETLGGAAVLDAREEQPRPLLPVLSPWRQARLVDQLAVDGAPALLARVDIRGEERLVWIDVRGDETVVEDVSRFLLARPVWAMAQPSGKRRLVLFDDGALIPFDDPAGRPLAAGLRGAGMSGHGVYALREAGVVERMNAEGEDRETLVPPAPLVRSLAGARGLFRILSPGDGLLLFWDEQGRLLANRMPYRFAREGILGLALDPRTSRALVWRRHAVGVLNYGARDDADTGSGHGPRLRWLSRELDRVEQAFWAYEGSHAVLLDGDLIRLLPVDFGAAAPMGGVLPVKRKTGILYAEPEGAVYFLSAAHGHLMRLPLLPRRERLPLPRPDRATTTPPAGVRR